MTSFEIPNEQSSSLAEANSLYDGVTAEQLMIHIIDDEESVRHSCEF